MLFVDHLEITKKLLNAKTEEIQELEFQWATVKGQLASEVSKKMDLEDRIDSLNGIISTFMSEESLDGKLQTMTDKLSVKEKIILNDIIS